MKLDREYQLHLLNMLSESYPKTHSVSDYLKKATEEDREKYIANMYYLGEHRLVEPAIQFSIDGRASVSMPRITKDGMDFIADDGGLKAILGVVTVKLHGDTIRDMIEAKIMASPLSQPEKQKFVDALKQLPADATKHLTMKVLDLGLKNWQEAWPAIQNYLQGLLS